MIKYFMSFEWKQYFRSSYWQKSMALNILLVFFALYMLGSLLVMGIALYPGLKKFFPESDPLKIVNNTLIYWFLFDLVFRYFLQKIPVMNIKPMLILPIKKGKLVHYVLRKSMVSFFNISPMFAFVPFGIMLIINDYDTLGALSWMFSMLFITQAINFLNFIVNKNNTAFFVVLSILAVLGSVHYFDVYPLASLIGEAFNSFVAQPYLVVVPMALLVALYQMNYKMLAAQIYLDEAVAQKVKEAKTTDLSWTDKLGDVAPFIKNDIRLIWRNKRPRTVFLMSFLFLFYGLIFFTQDIYIERPAVLVFAAIFVTGGFAINFGQFIPAWDSAYYNMLMSQNIQYRKFLESKWYLMVVSTTGLFLLSIPYAYFGWKIFMLVTVGAVFNLGFTSLCLLFFGAFNTKRIELDKSAVGNYQGTSAKQFIMIIPVMGFPTILFYGFYKLISFEAGIMAIAAVGILGLLLRNVAMNFIEQKYLERKHKTIHAFGQKA